MYRHSRRYAAAHQLFFRRWTEQPSHCRRLGYPPTALLTLSATERMTTFVVKLLTSDRLSGSTMHSAEPYPHDEQWKQAHELFAQLSALHAQLDALDAAIAAKKRKMSEYGSLDPDIRNVAAEVAASGSNP